MNRIFGYNTITYKDLMYIVHAKIRESHNPNVETWRDYYGCQTVLKHDGYYYFCELIEDAEILEDENKQITINEEVK